MNKNATWALTATLCALAAAECKIPGRKTNEQILAESSEPKALTLYRDRLATFQAYCDELSVYERNGRSTEPPQAILTESPDGWSGGEWREHLELGKRVDEEDLLAETLNNLRTELDRLGMTTKGTLRCGERGGPVSNHLRVKKKK